MENRVYCQEGITSSRREGGGGNQDELNDIRFSSPIFDTTDPPFGRFGVPLGIYTTHYGRNCVGHKCGKVPPQFGAGPGAGQDQVSLSLSLCSNKRIAFLSTGY